MFLAGAHNLEAHKEWINELNVFPVPDGDTGTNMTMTVLSAAKEVSSLKEMDMNHVAKAMSSGSLRGARGNSGVILSQILRGFCKVIRDYDEITTQCAVQAFQKGTETAYKAVIKPKEGTILTVVRGFSDKAAELYEADNDIPMEKLLEGSLEAAKEMLQKTPEMLPVLKEAGVVDSGGQGLIEILQGAYDLYCGKEVTFEPTEEDHADVCRIYCTELIIHPEDAVPEAKEEALRADLLEIGEDVVVLYTDGEMRIHLHTEDPGAALSRAIRMGMISDIKVENLSLGHREKVIKAADRKKAEEIAKNREMKEKPGKEVGFVSVSVGEGLSNIFRDLGVDCLIEGGQTMNPSTEDVLNAIDQVNAKNVFVFPNNKNIILAATQAQELAKDKKVIVIPTKTIPQGITALISYMPEKTPRENEAEMYRQIKKVKTCQLTYAVRDTHLDDKDIHEGDIMGVGDKGILAVGTDITETAVNAVNMMADDDSELISIYYGQDITPDEAQRLCAQVQESCPQCEVELNRGDQPIYYYIISVE